MKLISGTRIRSGTYTVLPQRSYLDQHSGRWVNTQPIRVKFRDHKGDTESSEVAQQIRLYCQETGEKFDEVQKMVDEHMLKHPDFGRVDGRGIFLDQSETIRQSPSLVQPDIGLQRRCLFMEDVGGETIQCEQMTGGERDYCEPHQAQVEALIG